MRKVEHLLASLGAAALLCVSGAAQQATAAGSTSGSAIKAIKPAAATNRPEPASMTIACQSAVDLMITDPQGKRLGDNPAAHTHYDEIPNAYYEAGGSDDDETGASEEDPGKTIFIPNPAAGIYKLMIVGSKAGKYSCQFSGQDAKGTREATELKSVAIGVDETQVFMVRFPTAAEAQIEVKKK